MHSSFRQNFSSRFGGIECFSIFTLVETSCGTNYLLQTRQRSGNFAMSDFLDGACRNIQTTLQYRLDGLST